MLARIDRSNSTGSCSTYPTCNIYIYIYIYNMHQHRESTARVTSESSQSRRRLVALPPPPLPTTTPTTPAPARPQSIHSQPTRDGGVGWGGEGGLAAEPSSLLRDDRHGTRQV